MLPVAVILPAGIGGGAKVIDGAAVKFPPPERATAVIEVGLSEAVTVAAVVASVPPPEMVTAGLDV